MLDITYYRAIKPPFEVVFSFLGYENYLMKTTLYVVIANDEPLGEEWTDHRECQYFLLDKVVFHRRCILGRSSVNLVK